MPKFERSEYLIGAAVVGLFIVSFLTFNILFNASVNIEYFKEVVAALIATLLTVTITTLLLKAQSKNEALKEGDVEVFRRRVDVFEKFIHEAVNALSDGRFSDDEARRLIDLTYQLSLFSSEETVETTARFVRYVKLGDNEVYSLADVISAFRRELRLTGTEAFTATDNLDGLERMLKLGEEGDALRTALMDHLAVLLNDLLAHLEDGLPNGSYLGHEPTGSGSGASFEIHFTSGWWVIIGGEYPDGGHNRVISVYYVTLNLKEVPAKARAKGLTCATAHGFGDLGVDAPDCVGIATASVSVTDKPAESDALSTTRLFKALLEIEQAVARESTRR